VAAKQTASTAIAGPGDQEARQRGAEDHRALLADLKGGVAGFQVLARHQSGQEGHAGRQEEGGHRAQQQRRRVDVPEVGGVRQHQSGEGRGHKGADHRRQQHREPG